MDSTYESPCYTLSRATGPPRLESTRVAVGLGNARYPWTAQSNRQGPRGCGRRGELSTGLPNVGLAELLLMLGDPDPRNAA